MWGEGHNRVSPGKAPCPRHSVSSEEATSLGSRVVASVALGGDRAIAGCGLVLWERGHTRTTHSGPRLRGRLSTYVPGSHGAFLKQAEMRTVLDAVVLGRCDSEHAQGSAAETYSGDRVVAARLWVNTSLPFILRATPQGQCGRGKNTASGTEHGTL